VVDQQRPTLSPVLAAMEMALNNKRSSADFDQADDDKAYKGEKAQFTNL
jgi:hypothetical protein